ncbi:hypothetical protein FQN54_003502 [Arachnomyces sp. PD_36]|nr:hypothetical protein FQN54_003502 [Arachnomyces sp. PD_36]
MASELKLGVLDKEKKPVLSKPKPKSLKRKTPSTRKSENAESSSKKAKGTKYLIIGVDFGTTYTGVSYVLSGNKPGDIQVITDWPGTDERFEKVPSIIAYGEENSSDGTKWGYEVDPSMTAYSWFKLRIVDGEPEEEYDDPLLRQSAGKGLLNLPTGKSAEDVCYDYLECLYLHVMGKLQEEWQDALIDMPLKFVLTTPAGWTDHAKGVIHSAAKRAGFGTGPDSSRMTDEPEAAALYSFARCGRSYTKNPFKMGSNAMIVDGGGGTADITTYKVTGWSPFKVEEACVGTSAKCGSTTIDRNLHALMHERYGAAFQEKADKIAIGGKFMKKFESIKRNFDGKPGPDFSLPLLMNGFPRVKITRDEMKAMFQEVLTRIFGLVRDQISAVKEENDDLIQTIVLCGGLAKSPYIKTELEKFCLKTFKHQIEIFVPPQPWSAIARGAALRALKPRSTIDSRQCRRSYGVSTHRKFIEGVDREEDAFQCPVGGKRADGIMKWHIKKGEKILQGDKTKWIDGYFVAVGNSGRLPIYASDLDDPPEMVDSKGLRKIGELPLDFSRLSQKAAKTSCIGGDEYSQQKVRIGQSLHTDTGVVEYIAMQGRKKLGCIHLEYEPRDADSLVKIKEEDYDEDYDEDEDE